ncbi:MAG: HDOD domain-containing protein [Ectothiorhodospiraceae bacterium]|nr:HDOD domain-containing protein [Ectothiorhodospiraceae bacterium]
MQTSLVSADALDRWLARLQTQDLPVLNRTVQRLCSIAADQDASTQDLAIVVLQDASLTSGVLRAANSAHFNRSGQEISTISRAIALLGFDTVRTIGSSLAVIDTLLQGATRERLIRIMRESVFAATQARMIAVEMRTGGPEQVFVAALLLRLGEMAFWCFADEREARSVERALADGQRSAALVEREALGFPLRDLSVRLARDWRLGELMEQALQARSNHAQGQIGCIQLGHALEREVRQHGWNGPSTAKVVERIIGAAGIPEERMRELLLKAQDESARIAEAFGIPISRVDVPEDTAGEEASHSRIHRPAPVLQLKILRELSLVMREKPQTHVILEMILEGLHRGVGMDRTLISILNQDRSGLRVKYAVGDTKGTLTRGLGGDLGDDHLAVVRHSLKTGSVVQLMSLSPEHQRRCGLEAFQQMIGGLDAILAPLVIRGRNIGLIYTDRIHSHRLLDEETVASVLHFSDQANLALEHLAEAR